jgi:IS4 transposase
VIGDFEQLEFVEKTDDDIQIHTAIVNSVSLKRNIRIVLLTYKNGYAVLFSTDTELDATSIYRYYKARFQIEFLFRDARIKPLPGTF